MSLTVLLSLAQSVVGQLVATNDATVVPHDPPPSTAIFKFIALRLLKMIWKFHL